MITGSVLIALSYMYYSGVSPIKGYGIIIRDIMYSVVLCCAKACYQSHLCQLYHWKHLINAKFPLSLLVFDDRTSFSPHERYEVHSLFAICALSDHSSS